MAGTTANAIAGNATRMANLAKAGYSLNLFQVNPNNGGTSVNDQSQFQHLQLRPDGGQPPACQRAPVPGQLRFAKSLTDANTPTLRNWGGLKARRRSISATGSRHLDLPAPDRAGPHTAAEHHGVLGKIVSGWEIAGVGRVQSGTPINILSGRDTFNQNDAGVVLHNMTAKQLQRDVGLNFPAR